MQAEAHCQESLAIRGRLVPDSLEAAKSLRNCGEVARDRADLVGAEEYHRKALAIRENLASGSLDFATSLADLGFVAYLRSDLDKAEEYQLRALALRQSLAPGSEETAASLVGIGIVAWRRSDLALAEDYLERARAVYEKIAPGSYNASATINNIGNVAWSRGDLAKADDSYRQALAIQEKLEPGGLEVSTNLYNLGAVAQQRGDLSAADAYYRRSLALAQRKRVSSDSVEHVLHGLGELAFGRGNFNQSYEYFRQALKIGEELAPDGEGVANDLDGIATVMQARGDLVGAEEYFERALSIQEKLASSGLDVAVYLHDLAGAERAAGNYSRAEEHYWQALAIREKLAPGSLVHAEVLHSLGTLLRGQGQTETAAEYLGRSIEALERQASRLGGGQESKSGFRAGHDTYYKDYVETLLALRQPEKAFLTTERWRARSLLEMLAERDLVFRSEIPAEIQKARRRNFAAYDETQEALSKLSPGRDATRIEQLVAELRELSSERDQLIERLRKGSPRLANLQYPQPLDLRATRDVLDPGTVLLSYSIGQLKTELFVVQATGIEPGFSVFTLPVSGETLKKQVEDFRKLILERRPAGDSAFMARSRELYDELVRPAESMISASERLLVVPDGALHQLPFQALLRNEKKQYLVEWKPLHTVASATVYAELKSVRRGEAKPIELVAFGDPNYPAPAEALSGRRGDAEVRSVAGRGLTLARLPFSRLEVEGISALYPRQSRTYLGAEATEERVKALGKDVRYIHFAVHGLLDERLPLNSALAMTIPEKTIRGRDNGLLQAWEIFEQVRLDADLVTLSACQTGLGQELSGEGLIGLTRAFLYAGAHSILASLWSVDDFQTMQLMKRFYSDLRSGKSKDEALRGVQMEFLGTRSASSPYYWAGFQLIGDWR
jgi:CHAT domain-containing protein/Tfp pilus assembly protein PilF